MTDFEKMDFSAQKKSLFYKLCRKTTLLYGVLL